MAWGDLIMRLMGEQDPAAQLQAALGQGPGQPGGAPGVATSPAPGAPMALPQGPMPNGAPVPAPQAPPQPQAYTSPPDLVSLYTKLQERQERNAGIDRGIGLLFSAFAHPENRAAMMASMAPRQQADPASQIDNLMKLQANQQDLQRKAQLRASLPDIAKKYGIDLQTATYLMESGGLDNYIQEVSKPSTPSSNRKDWLDYKSDQEAMGKKPEEIKTFEDWMASENKAREKWAVTPQFVDSGKEDADGNPILKSIVASDAGNVKDYTDSEGHPILKKAAKVETDTTVEFRDPITGALIKTVPKNVQAGAEEKATGAAVADLKLKLPGTETTIRDGLRMVDEVLGNEKGLEGATGKSSLFTGITKYTDADVGKVQSKIDSLQGKAFLTAFENLRGGGAISNAEGEAATAAISRLKDQNLQMDDYKQALGELRSIMLKGIINGYKKTGQEPPKDLIEQLDKAIPPNPDAPGPGDPDVPKKRRKYNASTGEFE